VISAELHHEIVGDGQPILLHPGFADSRIWDPQWASYAERFQVIRCDMRGFGRSPVRSLPVTYARDVATLLDELDIRDAAIVGCSLGGRVALELAIARPELVRALVLIGAATSEALAAAPEMAEYSTDLMEAIGRQDLNAAAVRPPSTWMIAPLM
jgi:3-oxoadipate enol-lactonase